MIRFACTHCGQAVSVDERHRGKLGRCPACDHLNRVPLPQPELVYHPRASQGQDEFADLKAVTAGPAAAGTAPSAEPEPSLDELFEEENPDEIGTVPGNSPVLVDLDDTDTPAASDSGDSGPIPPPPGVEDESALSGELEMHSAAKDPSEETDIIPAGVDADLSRQAEQARASQVQGAPSSAGRETLAEALARFAELPAYARQAPSPPQPSAWAHPEHRRTLVWTLITWAAVLLVAGVVLAFFLTLG